MRRAVLSESKRSLRLSVIAVLIGASLPTLAIANGHGHHGGFHHGGFHHGGFQHAGFHGHGAGRGWYGGYAGGPVIHRSYGWHHGGWGGYPRTGFYRTGYGYRAPWAWGYGVGYGPAVRYRYGWPAFGCANFAPAWGYGYYGGYSPWGCGVSPVFWNAWPVVAPIRVPAVRVRRVWVAAGDAVPAGDLDGIGAAAEARLAARGPVPMPPDDESSGPSAGREVTYPLVRESSGGARRRAESYVELGDKLYRKGQWHAALTQYKLAATAASDWETPYLRQAFASIAVGRYDQAAPLVRRAVRLDPRLARGDFRLATLYGDRADDKLAHLESLAAAALARPDDPELPYLIGVALHFDGEPERAQKFFAHAARFDGGATDATIVAFLDDAAAELAASELDL